MTSVGSELYSGTGLTALVTLCFVFNPLFPCPREYVYPIHTERALTPFLNTMTCQAIFSQTLLPFDHTLSLSLTVFFCFVLFFCFYLSLSSRPCILFTSRFFLSGSHSEVAKCLQQRTSREKKTKEKREMWSTDLNVPMDFVWRV